MKRHFFRIILVSVMAVIVIISNIIPYEPQPEVSVMLTSGAITYVSLLKSEFDNIFAEKGIKSVDYDGNNSETVQTEQITTAISKGTDALLVGVCDANSASITRNICEKAASADIPIVFYNKPPHEQTLFDFEKTMFVGTDPDEAGHLQGQMVGQYLLEHYDETDLNHDGVISYVMFKGEEGNAESEGRTKYAVQDANEVLTQAGKPELSFYDKNNTNCYLLDQNGTWSAKAASEYMQTVLSAYNEANGNMVELIIANNDDMALGSISALQNAGYNDGSGTTIPVFGVDANDSAKAAIAMGMMKGSIMQDAAEMARVAQLITENFTENLDPFANVDEDYIVNERRVNIPYSIYTGESDI